VVPLLFVFSPPTKWRVLRVRSSSSMRFFVRLECWKYCVRVMSSGAFDAAPALFSWLRSRRVMRNGCPRLWMATAVPSAVRYSARG
jgi:hypothetical protein